MESDPSPHLVQLLSNSLDMDPDSDLDLITGPGYEYTLASAVSVQPNLNRHYAAALYDLADRLSDNIGPFLGVHRRMEDVPMQNLAWCAASLVNRSPVGTLRALLQDNVTGKSMRHAWLATDHRRLLNPFMDDVRFPVDDGRMSDGTRSGMDGSTLEGYGPLRKSHTFEAISSKHDDAICQGTYSGIPAPLRRRAPRKLERKTKKE